MPDPSRLLHRALRGTPPVAVGGQGVWLHDADGRAVIDGSGGAAVACLGHGHPRVIAAMHAQIDRLCYAHTGRFSSEPAETLAQQLVGHAPGGLSHAWFCSSGSEGMEAALKLARQYMLELGQPDRTRFIARRGSYHGNTLGALAVGGNPARRAPYAPILTEAVSHVSPCFGYRDRRPHETEAEHVARLAAELEAEFRRVGADRVIAFVMETVVGATLGCVPPLPGYLAAVRDICDRHGALLILDEVMCGMGRCGTLHAWEAEGVAPDIQVIAKGLGGGYQPIGGMLVARHVARALTDGSGVLRHGHTYQAHPVACAAAVAVQQAIAEDRLIDNVATMGERLDRALHERLGNHAQVGDIRGRGLFRAVEFVADRTSRTPFDPALRLHERIGEAAFARGLICYPMGGTAEGVAGDHVILAPPYIATAAEIDLIADRFADAARAALAGID